MENEIADPIFSDVDLDGLDDERLGAEIDSRISVAGIHGVRYLRQAAHGGAALRVARERVGQGGFTRWLDEHTQCSRATAYRYIKISERWSNIESRLDGGEVIGIVQACTEDQETEEAVEEIPEEDDLEGDGDAGEVIDEDKELPRLIGKLSAAARAAYDKGTIELARKELVKLGEMSHTDQDRVCRDVRVGNEESFGKALGLNKRVISEDQEESIANARKAKPGNTMKDGHGRLIPSKELRDVFQSEKFKEWKQLIKDLRKKVKSIRGVQAQFIVGSEIKEVIDQLEAMAINATPKYLCPGCNGNKCDVCRQTGWVPAYRYSEYQMGKQNE